MLQSICALGLALQMIIAPVWFRQPCCLGEHPGAVRPADSPSIAYNWFVRREKDHRQPEIDPTLAFAEEYGAYFIDHRHTSETDEKVLYLTFDAGYENGNVEKILDVLKEEQVCGAFFVLSHLIDQNADLVRRMVSEGHLVCNHTAHHKDMTRCTSKEEFCRELNCLNEKYKALIGEDMPKFYRPPEGKFSRGNLACAMEAGYKTIFWSFAYADWDNAHQPSVSEAKKKISDNIHNGAVLLLHPTSATNAAVLRDLIVEWKQQGYRFGTLYELTAEPAQ